eukprot:COSAG01_NODE_23284_length_821_cov_0.754848_1_plen_230_part_10
MLATERVLVAVTVSKNGDETGIDCGGGTCARCLVPSPCSVSSDCASDQCEETATGKMCTSCFNGVRDGAETGVDCGGSLCSQRCEVGRACLADGDCMTGKCGTDVSGQDKCASWHPLCVYTAAVNSPVLNLSAPEDCTAASMATTAAQCSAVTLTGTDADSDRASCLNGGACVYSSASGGSCVADPIADSLLQTPTDICNIAKSYCRVERCQEACSNGQLANTETSTDYG